MNAKNNNRDELLKNSYESPIVEIMVFEQREILTASGESTDENIGEWDPQSEFFNN